MLHMQSIRYFLQEITIDRRCVIHLLDDFVLQTVGLGKRNGEFDITDGAFLPDGDLLLLERSFSMSTGVKMRLRRIYGESVAKGTVADGPVLLEADMGYQIDNMEAMDVWIREDGATMVSLMSDDNHSILQRNLYLEFVLHAE